MWRKKTTLSSHSPVLWIFSVYTLESSSLIFLYWLLKTKIKWELPPSLASLWCVTSTSYILKLVDSRNGFTLASTSRDQDLKFLSGDFFCTVSLISVIKAFYILCYTFILNLCVNVLLCVFIIHTLYNICIRFNILNI